MSAALAAAWRAEGEAKAAVAAVAGTVPETDPTLVFLRETAHAARMARWEAEARDNGGGVLADLVSRIGALLASHGCDCECGHDSEGHDDDCEQCLGCQIEDVLGGVR